MAKPQRMRELLRKKCFLLWIVQVTPAFFFVCRNCAHDGMRNRDKKWAAKSVALPIESLLGIATRWKCPQTSSREFFLIDACPEVNHLWEVIPKSGPKGEVCTKKLGAKSQMQWVCHVGEWQGKALQGRGGEGCWLRQPSTSPSNISRPVLHSQYLCSYFYEGYRHKISEGQKIV